VHPQKSVIHNDSPVRMITFLRQISGIIWEIHTSNLWSWSFIISFI